MAVTGGMGTAAGVGVATGANSNEQRGDGEAPLLVVAAPAVTDRVETETGAEGGDVAAATALSESDEATSAPRPCSHQLQQPTEGHFHRRRYDTRRAPRVATSRRGNGWKVGPYRGHHQCDRERRALSNGEAKRTASAGVQRALPEVTIVKFTSGGPPII